MGKALLSLAAAATLCPAAAPDDVPGRLIVRQRIGVERTGVERVLSRHGARLHRQLQSRLAVVSILERGGDAIEESLRRSGLFEFVERDHYAHTAAVPNDASYASQWYLPRIQAPAAWDVTTGSPGMTVAVVDSGVDATHPDLRGKIAAGWNFVDGNANTADQLGHGTAVSGVIAAAANNGDGIAGLTWAGTIMPVVVVDSSDYAAYSNIAAGIQYAADHGARIINVSLGGKSPSLALQSAIDYAWSKGAVVFAAAMNASTSAQFWPAACDRAVAVAATDQNDLLAPFSDFGTWLAISAPGTSILTTNRGGGYGYWSGTSFATPVVAGVAALALAANSSLSADALVRILEQNADDVGTPGFDDRFGWGRVNALRAVAAAVGRPFSAVVPASVSVQPVSAVIRAGEAVQFTAAIRGAAGYEVKWSIDPAIGSITTNGRYVAPDDVTEQRTVMVTAASPADAAIRASATVVITPLPCTFGLNINFAEVDAGGGIQVVRVNQAGKCPWTARSGAGWARVAPAEGTGAATLEITVAPNFSTRPRTATVTIAGQAFSVVQRPSSAARSERLTALLYFGAFGRPASAAEVTHVAASIEQGLAAASLVGYLFNSSEFQAGARFAAAAEAGLLGRDPDYAGWSERREELAAGSQTPEQVVSGLLQSPEFQAAFGKPDDAAFVRLLYGNILTRPPQDSEIAQQTAALGGGASRPSVAAALLNSSEFRSAASPRLTAFLLYACLLQRDPTSAERGAMVAYLSAGGLFEGAAESLLASPEFTTLLQ